MRKLLSMVMAKHMGETITMETAKEMMRELFADVSFPPERLKVIGFKRKSLPTCCLSCTRCMSSTTQRQRTI